MATIKGCLPLADLDPTASVLLDWQQSALIRLKAAQAKERLVELAREKLANIEGRRAR